MRGKNAALAVGVMMLASSFARRAAADDARTSSLSWLRMPGTDTCIATQALARSVEERLGRRVFVSAAEADVSVEGRIEKRAAAWHAVITIRDSKGALLGTRELDRANGPCEAMNDPLALVIAVMIDPEARLGERPVGPPPSPVPVPVPVPAPPPPADTPAPAPPPPKEPWRAEGDAYVALIAGVAPTLDPGAGVAGILYVPGIPIGVRGYANLYLPTVAEKDGARASFDLVYVGGALCPTWRAEAVTTMLCFGGHLGVLRSHAETAGRGIDDTTKLVLNAVGEARMSLPIVAPIALTAGISGVLPVLRPTFEYTPSNPAAGRDDLHKVSVYALAVDAGVGFFFP